jgi:hypothetical protein
VESDSLTRRIRKFTRIGLIMATGFSLFLLPFLLTGPNRPLPKYGLTPLQIVAVYYAGGIFGSSAVAVLYPIRRWFLGAFLLGAIAAAPVYLGFSFLMRGDDPASVAWVIGGVLAFFAGGGLGTQLWSETHKGPTRTTVRALWTIVAACQVVGWYLGMRWPGEVRAAIGLGLVFLPLFLALLATVSYSRLSI